MEMISDVYRGFRSLLKGMGVTIRHFFRKPVTVEYPRERAVVSKVQRNAIVLIEKDDIGSHNCIACLQCEKICPSNCISITGSRKDGLAFKRPDTFDLNFALCSECGLCLDVCPTDTLGYSKQYDKAGYSREDFFYDLLDQWKATEETALGTLREIERKKKEEREARRKADAEAKAKAKENDDGDEKA
ncbi:MAG: NADH-quinone oxidoreductase subunit I [Candidatus Sumerlaeia bacterium]|nr:NADH-quinone oxidoreductase subunit I [Candidatus Sumerlaeia bacterium]